MPPSKRAVNTPNSVTGTKLTIDFIDVGQGNCILVSLPSGEYLLVDAGTTSDNSYRDWAIKYINSVVGTERLRRWC